jgi:hypothetical protein
MIPKKSIRYLPTQAFPPYAFLPGRDLHPNLDGGYRFKIADPKPAPIDIASPFLSDALRFAVDLFNHEFYWESHIYAEALWNAHERTGATAVFLKAFIKLSAAGVKWKGMEISSARLHLTRAQEQLLQLQEKEGSLFLGFSLVQLIGDVEHSLRAFPEDGHSEMSNTRIELFEIHPEWK